MSVRLNYDFGCLRKTQNRELENVSAEHLSLLLSPLQNSKSNNNFMYLTWATKTTTTTKAKAKAKATKAAKGTTSSRVLEWLL